MNRRVPQRSGASLALPLVLVALLFAVQACESAVTPPTRKEAASYSESPPPSGESVKFSVYTHCGVESARIGGHWWHATPPLYGESASSAPAGWDDPSQEGQLTVESSERAVFEAEGTQVVFVPSATNEPVRICR